MTEPGLHHQANHKLRQAVFVVCNSELAESSGGLRLRLNVSLLSIHSAVFTAGIVYVAARIWSHQDAEFR